MTGKDNMKEKRMKHFKVCLPRDMNVQFFKYYELKDALKLLSLTL